MKTIDRQYESLSTKDMSEPTQPWFDKTAGPATLTPEQLKRQEAVTEILEKLIRRQI